MVIYRQHLGKRMFRIPHIASSVVSDLLLDAQATAPKEGAVERGFTKVSTVLVHCGGKLINHISLLKGPEHTSYCAVSAATVYSQVSLGMV